MAGGIVMNRIRLSILMMAIVICLSGVSCTASDREIYSGTDPRVFENDRVVVVIQEADKKIESPDKLWIWHNSWHVTRRQPGIFKREMGKGPYTLTNSFDARDFAELTWVHYSFYIFRGPIRESYDCNIREIEDRIWKERKHSANVVRIDKLEKDFYVVTYRRSKQKRFDLRKVDGYPLFNLGGNIRIGVKAIFLDVKVKSLDPYGRAIFTYQPMKISMRDILLLNPALLRQPAELEDVVIPYEFFADNFIYEHPGIRKHAQVSGDPMVVKITEKGVVYRFYKQPIHEEL